MSNLRGFRPSRLAFTAVAAAAMLTVSAGVDLSGPLGIGHDGQAHAQSQGQGGGGRGGSGYRGGRGAAGGGSTSHEHDDSGHSGGSGGSGGHDSGSSGHDDSSSGSHSDSEGGHPRYKAGTSGTGTDARGGRPVWAQEGIPEVELGRLNVIRSPSHVIDRALAEAVSTFNPTASAALYSMNAEAFSDYVQANWNSVTMIDSPLQNLGLLRDLLSNGSTQLSGVAPASRNDLAAIFLGTASDKTMPISQDTVTAVTKMMGATVNEADIAAIAVKAEDVRQGILTGHGE